MAHMSVYEYIIIGFIIGFLWPGVYLLLVPGAHVSPDLNLRFKYGLFGALGAILPDLLEDRTKDSHKRSFAHSVLVFLFVTTLITFLKVNFFPPAYPFLAGYAVHLLINSFSGGIPWFY